VIAAIINKITIIFLHFCINIKFHLPFITNNPIAINNSTSLIRLHKTVTIPELKDFIKNNPNIIFTRADKGNITVTLEKTEYLNKIEEMLNDTETYEKINKDPTKKRNMRGTDGMEEEGIHY